MSKKLGIVGAGPVGSLLSIALARAGHRSKIYERRPDMRVHKISAGRSINLALSVRGIHALEQVGLKESVLARAIPMKGRVIHLPDGQTTYQPYGKDDSECIYSVSRGELNELLMNHAQSSYGVEIEFDRKIFDSQDLPEHSILFGTDGSASALRAEILESTGGKSTEDLLDYGYKELILPSSKAGGFQIEKNGLHIWPRGSFMLIALPNFDGSFTCTLFLKNESTQGPSFSKLKNEGDITQFFTEYFSDALSLMPSLIEDFFEHPTGQMVTVKCAPWTDTQKTLLLGDAAHAIVPFFGQGMNAGFEDVSLFSKYLQSEGQISWPTLFDRFWSLRKPDADAIADLALANFVEMRDRVADPRFQLERKVEKILEKQFPDRYLSRYALVTFTRMPYSLAKKAGQIQDKLLTELCQNLTNPDDVNLLQASSLITERLGNLLNRTQ